MMETKTHNKYLKFLRFQNVQKWDIKRYFTTQIKSAFEIIDLSNVITEQKNKYSISDPQTNYGILGVNNNFGIFDAYIENGSKIKQKYKRMEYDWIAYNPYRVNVGSIGIRQEINHYEYISPAYVVFSCKKEIIPRFLFLVMKTNLFHNQICENTTGSVRQNLSYDILKTLQIPLPSTQEQNSLISIYDEKIKQAVTLKKQASEIEINIEKYLINVLDIQRDNIQDYYEKKEFLQKVSFRNIVEWGINKIKKSQSIKSAYDIFKIKDIKLSAFRGKSPVYKEGTTSYILNQKCNKWDFIDKRYMKSVDEKWLSNIESSFFTKEGDILINSTGEGTIGRSSYISSDSVDLLCDTHILLLRLKQTVNPHYFVYFFNSSIGQEQVEGVKSAQATKQTELGIDNLCKITIPLPDKSIQDSIVAHINTEKEKIKYMKAEAERLRNEALTEFEKSIFE
ncbi:restriction endonuclease subunit S [Xylanibacter oryzae]|uniref:restriction endonuclease subunit S n=1 Tax=Xylanibacter oryzae TaxID=185293 RepID=UPI0004B14F61|nr:restriction endonuclease subunit S [Xylanibacter oryzae]